MFNDKIKTGKKISIEFVFAHKYNENIIKL